MNDSYIVEKAAEIAREIAVAGVSATSKYPTSASGKEVADYYSEIYKGVYETLKSGFESKK
jgi:hypothetical protein